MYYLFELDINGTEFKILNKVESKNQLYTSMNNSGNMRCHYYPNRTGDMGIYSDRCSENKIYLYLLLSDEITVDNHGMIASRGMTSGQVLECIQYAIRSMCSSRLRSMVVENFNRNSEVNFTDTLVSTIKECISSYASQPA